ncbi:TPA: hypothetical protein ACF2P3_002614, partial [Legionella pneumophila]
IFLLSKIRVIPVRLIAIDIIKGKNHALLISKENFCLVTLFIATLACPYLIIINDMMVYLTV